MSLLAPLFFHCRRQHWRSPPPRLRDPGQPPRRPRPPGRGYCGRLPPLSSCSVKGGRWVVAEGRGGGGRGRDEGASEDVGAGTVERRKDRARQDRDSQRHRHHQRPRNAGAARHLAPCCLSRPACNAWPDALSRHAPPRGRRWIRCMHPKLPSVDSRVHVRPLNQLAGRARRGYTPRYSTLREHQSRSIR